MVVDNEAEGYVYDYSESCPGILKDFGLNPSHSSCGLVKRISDIVPDIDFKNIVKTRDLRYRSREIYESEHMIDLKQLEDNQDQS